MKIFSLIYDNRVCGYRFLFEKRKLAYDINIHQVNNYFPEELKPLKVDSSLELVYNSDTDSFVTQEEINKVYNVLSGEFDDSLACWLYEALKLDSGMDKGSSYILKSNNNMLVTIVELFMQTGKVVVMDGSSSVQVSIRDLVKE